MYRYKTTLGPRGNLLGRPRGVLKDRSKERCKCGGVQSRLKFNEPVCERCDRLEHAGFTGGPLIREIVKSPEGLRREAYFHQLP